jgi:hypothetical protein
MHIFRRFFPEGRGHRGKRVPGKRGALQSDRNPGILFMEGERKEELIS